MDNKGFTMTSLLLFIILSGVVIFVFYIFFTNLMSVFKPTRVASYDYRNPCTVYLKEQRKLAAAKLAKGE